MVDLTIFPPLNKYEELTVVILDKKSQNLSFKSKNILCFIIINYTVIRFGVRLAC